MATSSKSTGGKTEDLFDAKLVRQLADILNETDLTEIEVERDKVKIRVARTITMTAAPAAYAPQAAAAPAPAAASVAGAPAAPAAPVRNGDEVKSPMVGTVYLQPSPGADAFVKV